MSSGYTSLMQGLPDAELEALAYGHPGHRRGHHGRHGHHRGHHTYTTTSLGRRGTSSLVRDLASLEGHPRRYSSLGRKSTTSLLRHGDSSLAMSLGQCPRGKVYDASKSRCVGLHSHTVAHHALKHALARANSSS